MLSTEGLLAELRDVLHLQLHVVAVVDGHARSLQRRPHVAVGERDGVRVGGQEGDRVAAALHREQKLVVVLDEHGAQRGDLDGRVVAMRVDQRHVLRRVQIERRHVLSVGVGLLDALTQRHDILIGIFGGRTQHGKNAHFHVLDALARRNEKLHLLVVGRGALVLVVD